MLDSLRRRQTLASFDYQWGVIPSGDTMLSDPWFVENADRILADELLGVDRRWFRGRYPPPYPWDYFCSGFNFLCNCTPPQAQAD